MIHFGSHMYKSMGYPRKDLSSSWLKDTRICKFVCFERSLIEKSFKIYQKFGLSPAGTER